MSTNTPLTPEEICILSEEFKKEAEEEFVKMVKSMLDEKPTEVYIEYNEEGEVEAVWF